MKLLVRLRPWTLLFALTPAAWGIVHPAWVAAYGGTDPPTTPIPTPPNAGGAIFLIETVFDDAAQLEGMIELMAAVDVLVR